MTYKDYVKKAYGDSYVSIENIWVKTKDRDALRKIKFDRPNFIKKSKKIR